MEANAHGILVGVELFGFSHQFYGVADMADAFICQMLEGDFSAITVKYFIKMISACEKCSMTG